MYAVLILAGVATGVYLVLRGFASKSALRFRLGLSVLLALPIFFFALSLWGELLWFETLGFESRFWTELWARLISGLLGGLLGGAVVFPLTRPIPKGLRLPFHLPAVVAVAIGCWWGVSVWDVILRFKEAVSTGVTEPILGRDVGFYLFRLPLYDQIYRVLLLFVGIALASTIFALVLQLRNGIMAAGPRELEQHRETIPGRALALALLVLAVVLGFGRYLDTFHLLNSDWGAVRGPGWTDAHVRLPAYWIGAVLIPLVSIALLWSSFRRALGRLFTRFVKTPLPVELAGLLFGWFLIAVGGIGGLVVLPALIQRLVVEPNEISFERPYIAHNIEFTRSAFGLDQAEEHEFPASDVFDLETVSRNRDLLSEVRLWDWHALDAVYKQFQEIRLYYEFQDVDVDRYQIGDRYRQVMVSARELEQGNLAESSRTFVNRRFKYTHGFGITLAPVSDFTEQGLPNLLVRDLPPQTDHEELEVPQPRIYYGELTNSPVYANTREEEFDHPQGDQNVMVRYDGKGGVELRNLWRKFVFGWKFDGTRFFFSSYPREYSRVLFHREIRDRVETIAPFLELDDDPYIALVDGRLLWIIDAYTTSHRYPYAAPFHSRESIEVRNGAPGETSATAARSLDGANYVRNSVKAVIDAYDGTVTLWLIDDDDPVALVWSRVFPDLFRDGTEMPYELRAHLRYPEDLLVAQGYVYSRYHMVDPDVFYNQEDLWVRATEKYYGSVRPVEPYYVMWRPPGSDSAEFVLMQPFSPKNRQVLIGWIAGMCDPQSYGRFLAYKFPKGRHVLGPQQVETKIDQDRFLSGQLTLWDQRGSTVIRGNVLAIPIDDTLLYVEPIYLRADTAAYPELRLVAVMHGDKLSYGETFEEALAGLTLGLRAEIEGEPERRDASDVLMEAGQLLDEFMLHQGQGRFEEAGRVLERLRTLLESANAEQPAETPSS